MYKVGATIVCLIFLVGAGCGSSYEPIEAPTLNPITPTAKKPEVSPITTTTLPKKQTKPSLSPNLLNQNYDEFSRLEIFASTSQAIYFQRQLAGLDGYVIFPNNQVPLIRVDRVTGEMLQITTKTKFTSPQDTLPDDSLIAYVVSEDPRGKGIVTIEPSTGLQKFYPISPPTPYTVIGDVRFSPNGKEVAFAMAANNPDQEQGAVYRLNLTTGKTTRVAATKPADNTYYRVLGWTPQDTVIYK